MLVVLLLCAASPSLATTYYVDPAGSGTDGLTWAKAFKTVQAALNKATKSGDVVEIGGGTYSEALTSKAAGVTIAGSTQAGHNGTVTIKGGNAQTVLTVSHQTTWRRLTFDASANTNTSYYAVKITAGNPTFEQCVIGPGQRLLSVAGTGATISRCVLKDIRNTNYADAVYLATTSGTVTFNYTMFLDMAFRYIQAQSSTTANFNNCLFAGFKDRLLYVPSGSPTVRWRNCLALANEGGFGYNGYPIIHKVSSTATVSLDHCLIAPIAPVHMTTTALYSSGVTVTNPLSGSPRLHHGRRPALINLGVDDQTNVGTWSKLNAECDLYGFKSTLALNTASATAADWTAIRDAVARGHEVASHTAHHVDLTARTGVLSIKYANSQATAATVTVDRSAMVLRVAVTGVSGAGFELPLGSSGAYPTLTALANAIKSHAGFTATTTASSDTGFDAGAFLSQDLAAVQNVSIRNTTASFNLDNTAMFADELTVPKQAIETNVPGYTCDALAYPFLEYDDATMAAATAAGYACARTGENGSYAMGDPAGYNLMLMFALVPPQIFGKDLDEATLRSRVAVILEWAKFTGVAFGLYAHGEDQYTLSEWRMLLRILAEDPDVEVVTLSEMARRIKAGAQSHTGATYVRTQWTDSANYQPEPHSPLIGAGVAVSGLTTDFGGTAVPQGGAPSVGLYEWPQASGVAADAGADAVIGSGGSGTLDGTGSISPATIASYGWTQVRGPATALVSPGASRCGYTAPTITGPRDPVSLLLKLTVTGIDGTTDYAYKRLTMSWTDAPPTASVLGLPASPTNQTTVALTVGGTNVTAYQYRLDGGTWSAATPVATPIALTVADGAHTLDVVGGDASGHWQPQSAPTTVTWTVDTQAPGSVTLSGQPAAQANIDSASITVSGADVTQYTYSLDGGAWSAATPVATVIALTNLTQGSHSIAIKGGDAAGNWQATPTVYTWTVDTQAPATVDMTGQPPAQTESDSASITVGGADVTQYSYSLDGGAWSAATPVATAISLTNLTQGSHSIAIKGGDAAGNWQATPTVYTWTVGAAATNVYYVDPAGSGGDGHSWATALRTVQAALNAATHSGDVVEISGGAYNETLTTVASGVTITGSTQAGHNGPVTIKGGNAQTVLTVAHQTTWRRLTFDASANTDASYYVVRVNGGHPSFDQCVIGPGQRLLNVGSGGADFTRTIIRDARRNAYGGAVYINAGATGATTFTYSMITDTGYGYIQVASGKQVDFNNCLLAGFGGGLLFLDTGVTVAGGVHLTNCLAISNSMKGNPLIENDAAGTAVTVDHCLMQPMAPYYLTSPKYVGNVTETNARSSSPDLHRGRRLALLNLGIDDQVNVGVWSQVADEAELYGFKTTLAMNTADATEADWTALRARVAKGHEVASHTAHHVYLSERRLFDIRYAGAEAATLTIDRQAMTLSVTVTGNSAASFSLPLSSTGAYSTVAKVQQYISSKPNFTCTLYTVAGTTYNSGSWLSRDMAAVSNASIKQTVTVSVDDTAANNDELAGPKAAIEQNLSVGGTPYVCDSLVYPYLNNDAAARAAAVAAGYTQARGGANDNFAMGSPDGYDVMRVWATEPGEIFGRDVDEATLRGRVSAVLEFAKFTGAAISLFSHGENEYTLAEWRTLIRLLAEDPDVTVATLREIARQVAQNAASHTGTIHYRSTWPDIADFVPGPHSVLVGAGAPYAAAVTDFGGMSIAAGGSPSIGLYEWPRDNRVDADAGVDETLTNTASGSLSGTGSQTPATIAGYGWTQVGGPTATLSGANSATAGFAVSGLTTPRSPVSVTFKLAVTGIDGTADYAYKRVTLTWPDAPPSATVLGLPASPTTQTTVTLAIGGTNVTAYQYRLDGGTWSSAAPVATPLTLTVPDGQHTLDVIGGDASGRWQSQTAPTTVTWTVDTVAPTTVTMTGQPPAQTESDSATITVGGTDVTQYSYSLDGGTWSTPAPVSTAITLTGLAQGSHSISIKGGDGAGNWQATPTVYTWTVGTVSTSVYYVDPNGSGGDGHTWATALRTVQAALNVATHSGDVVEISGGTYNEVLTTKAAGVTITGSTQAGHNGPVTIKGGNAQTVLTVAHQTTWRRLTFDASANTDASYYVVRVNGGHPTFDQCVIGPGQRLLNVGSGGADFTRTVIRDARRSGYGGALYLNAGASGATTFTYCLIGDTGYGYIQLASGQRIDFNNCLLAGFGGGVMYAGPGVAIAGGVHLTNCLGLSNGLMGNPLIENEATGTAITVDHCLMQPMAPYYLTDAKYVGNVIETNPRSGSPDLHRGRRLALLNLGIDDAINVGVWKQVADEAELYGFKTTLALDTANVAAADWAAMQARVAKGHEVASHTAHHVYLPERRLFDIRYAGAEAATLTIDRQAMTLSVTVTGNSAASFSLPLSSTGAYSTVAKVQQYISAKPNFTCTLYTLAGSSYNSGQWLSRDMAAVSNVSIKQTVTVSVDDAAANNDELAAPKAAIEQNIPSYTCDSLVYPYLHTNASVQAAAAAAGYTQARASSDDCFAMGSPDGYDVMRVWATEPGEIFGRDVDEATLRQRVSAVLEFAKFTGAAISLFSHGEADYTVAEWRTLIRLLAEDPDVTVVTLRELAQQVAQNANSHTGTTYYRSTWPEVADYIPGPHSVLIGAGAPYAAAVTDFGGMALAAGSSPSIGLYEWPRDNRVDADAGADQTLANATSGSLSGTGSLTPATIAGYGWTQVGGPTATLSGAGSATAGFSLSGLATPRPPVSLTFKLAVTGTDGTADYAYKRVTLTWPGAAPSATVLGLPASPTKQTSVNLTVGGAGVTSYQYRLDGGTWSSVYAVATPITLTVANGAHTLDVVGGDASGNWQSKTAPTTVTWTVDTSAP